MIKINNFEEMICFIESNELTTDQLNILISDGLKIWCNVEQLTLPKSKLVKKLREYWTAYGDNIEKPLFLINLRGFKPFKFFYQF